MQLFLDNLLTTLESQSHILNDLLQVDTNFFAFLDIEKLVVSSTISQSGRVRSKQKNAFNYEGTYFSFDFFFFRGETQLFGV